MTYPKDMLVGCCFVPRVGGGFLHTHALILGFRDRGRLGGLLIRIPFLLRSIVVVLIGLFLSVVVVVAMGRIIPLLMLAIKINME